MTTTAVDVQHLSTDVPIQFDSPDMSVDVVGVSREQVSWQSLPWQLTMLMPDRVVRRWAVTKL